MEAVAVLLGADRVGRDGEVGVLGEGRVVLEVLQVHPQLILLLQCQEVQVLQPWEGAGGVPVSGDLALGAPSLPGPTLPSQYSPSARPKPSL